MVVLFIGDIVGPVAAAHVAACAPRLRRIHEVDLLIANAENSAPSGLGMAVEQRDLLLASGVDIITGGNHSWDGSHACAALMHQRVLRPHNVPADVPGSGLLRVCVGDRDVTILNLGETRVLDPLKIVGGRSTAPYMSWLHVERCGEVIVDFHGEHVIEKQTFAYLVDGEAAAVLGTHTHEPTLPLHILPGGTGLVTDVGMTGPLGGIQGFAHENLVDGMRRTGDCLADPLPGPVEGPIALGAVLLQIENNRTHHIERIL